jgi:hypothetical protein
MEVTVKRRKVDPIESVTVTFTAEQFRALIEVAGYNNTVAEALRKADSSTMANLSSVLLQIWDGVPRNLRDEVAP